MINYNQLINKPQINGVELIGDKSFEDLGLVNADEDTDGLMSSEDYVKLSGIEEGAQANVQADWTQSDSTSDDYIKNKPTLGTASAKNYTSSVTDGSTDLVESGAVHDAIASAISSVYKPSGDKTVLFERESLRYWDGIIPNDDRESRTVAVIDPAFGGGDSLSMPICRDYGDRERYIIDWVFNAGTQKVTIPKIVQKIKQHYITLLRIEQNSGGRLLADNIKDALAKEGVLHCKIELVSAPVRMSKEDKISGYSDFVKEHFIFLFLTGQKDKVAGHRYNAGAEYRKAMEELCMYSPQGRNLHDDAPDSLTQLAMLFEKKHNGEISVPMNPFKMY